MKNPLGNAGEIGRASYAETFRQQRADFPRQFRAEIERRLWTTRASAAGGDWRPAAWLLERQFPAEFGGRHEDQRDSNGLLPAGSVQPIVHVTVHRDEATDAARKLFGTPPPNRTKFASLPMPD